MFIIVLRFSSNRAQASAFLEAHKAWIQRGVRDGIFLLTGSLVPGAGGVILAHGATRSEIDARVAEDPFVIEDVVRAEILEVQPSVFAEPMRFLQPKEAR